MPISPQLPKFLPGSAYGPRHARAHASVMRAIRKMTPAEFLVSLERAELGPVLDIGGARAAATKKQKKRPAEAVAPKRASKKATLDRTAKRR